MTWTLISATPSPYARKIRIALQEKNLPFTLQTEVPWDSTTQTPLHNPLEKLPVLILDDEKKTALYESHYILDWLETKYPEPALLPEDVDERLEAKKVEVVADGVCDALVLALFESKREPEKQSKPWMDRYVYSMHHALTCPTFPPRLTSTPNSQMRKVAGGLQALNDWVSASKDGKHILANTLTIADLATVSLLGFMDCRWQHYDWKAQYPKLLEYWQWHEDSRESFRITKPSPQVFSDAVV